MATVTPNVAQVPRLTTEQIAQFKRDGFLVLPAVLDLELCRQTREQMWELIAEHRPSMKRDDPATWLPFSDEEREGYKRPDEGGDPYFGGGGHRLYIRNGAEELLLDLAPRALWNVAEQLLGEGTVVWPGGLDETDTTIGPALMTEDVVGMMKVHLGPESERWTGKATFKTEQIRLPKTGPVWATGQGSRGLYCTLPNCPPPGRNRKYPHAKVQPSPRYPSAHAAEGMYDSRRRLQIAAYFDDLPPGAGGLHLWPRSFQRIWDTWSAMHSGEIPSNDDWLSLRHSGGKFDGYVTPPISEIKEDTPPLDAQGPCGSVVLWHANMLHMAGQNTTSDVIRQATIYGYNKTEESLPDELALAYPDGDLWRDWSDELRATETAS
jgi:hypothetical protein